MLGTIVLMNDRPETVFDCGEQCGGLHCGECFRYYNGEWLDVRLEYQDGWAVLENNHAYPIVYGSKVKK